MTLVREGQTAVFNFTPAFGAADKEFFQRKNRGYWFYYPPAQPAGVQEQHLIEFLLYMNPCTVQ